MDFGPALRIPRGSVRFMRQEAPEFHADSRKHCHQSEKGRTCYKDQWDILIR